MSERVVSTHPNQAEAYVSLMHLRASEPRADFDLRDVRYADPPIRSANRWAVVRVLGGSDAR